MLTTGPKASWEQVIISLQLDKKLLPIIGIRRDNLSIGCFGKLELISSII
jgi:hypothetical protein